MQDEIEALLLSWRAELAAESAAAASELVAARAAVIAAAEADDAAGRRWNELRRRVSRGIGTEAISAAVSDRLAAEEPARNAAAAALTRAKLDVANIEHRIAKLRDGIAQVYRIMRPVPAAAVTRVAAVRVARPSAADGVTDDPTIEWPGRRLPAAAPNAA